MIRLRPTSATIRFMRTVPEMEHDFVRGLRNGMFDIGQLAALEANVMINNNGRTGHVYFINGAAHQSSAPGEAPANLSGKLKKGMDYVVHGTSDIVWGSTVSYGKWLEKGTRKMEPRPYLTVVHKKIGSTARNYLVRGVQDALKRRR